MGKAIIGEEMFPEIVQQYNLKGKAAVYEFLQNTYGIAYPSAVIRRIRKSGKYSYDPDTDQFTDARASIADDVFMDLEELCPSSVTDKKTHIPAKIIMENHAVAMDKLIHELVSDRLLILSRYISLDSSSRTILIDQTSLEGDGFQVLTH